jgi:hypothetical protein
LTPTVSGIDGLLFIAKLTLIKAIKLTGSEKEACMRVLESLLRTPRLGFAIAVLLLLCGGLLPASRQAVMASSAAWSSTGPGIIFAVVNASTDWDLSYSLNRGADFAGKSGLFSATAPESVSYHFLWSYSGILVFFQVIAFLGNSTGEILADSGLENGCATPPAGFLLSGGLAFPDGTAGDATGCIMGVGNLDSDNRQQLAEPETLMPLVLGLPGLRLSGTGAGRVPDRR